MILIGKRSYRVQSQQRKHKVKGVMAETGHGQGQVNLQYTMGGTGHVCKDARQLKESTQQRSEEIGLASVSDFVATVAVQVQCEC